MKDLETVPTSSRLLNIGLLSAGWCLSASCLFIQVSIVTLAAADLAGKSAATVPSALFNVAAAVSVIPGTMLMLRYGRRTVFICASTLGLLGGLIQLLGLWHGGYTLLVLGAVVQGFAFSTANNYRFAAAEFSTPAWRPRAISLVVFGGVLAAGIGPEISRRLRFSLQQGYAGSLVLLCCLYLLHILVVCCIDYKLLQRLAAAGQQGPPAAAPTAAGDSKDSTSAVLVQEAVGEDGQTQVKDAVVVKLPDQAPAETPLLSYRQLLLNHEFIVPALCAGLCFCTMAALMSVTPIAMRDYARPDDESIWVIEAHIVGMYLPGLLSADLMRVTGPHLLMALGAVVITAGNAWLYAGGTIAVFMPAMTLVGAGWNFGYVAASTLITAVYAKEPRRRLQVQGATDTVVLTLTGAAIGSSSSLTQAMGWRAFCTLYLAVNVVLVLLTAGYLLHRLLVVKRLK